MSIYRLHLSCLALAVLLSGCIGGYPLDAERVRRENPKVFREWITNLRKRGVTDDELRKMGVKDPLPTFGSSSSQISSAFAPAKR
jgi:hypothetical protein